MKKFLSRLVRDVVNCFLMGAGIYGIFHGVRCMKIFADCDIQQDMAEALAKQKKEELVNDEDIFEED